MHQDARYARNHESPKEVESRSVRGLVVQQDARYMELRAGCVIRTSKYTRQYGKNAPLGKCKTM